MPNSTMNTVWLEDQAISIKNDVPIPRISEGEALVRVILAGICSTDLELARGYYPFKGVMGHEFVGIVVDVDGDAIWLDKRVVGEINIYCNNCDLCQDGLTSHCRFGKAIGIRGHDGVFAEFLAIPIRNLHLIPEKLDDHTAIFTELLAAALRIQTQLSIQSYSRVFVIGAGRLGLLVAQSLSSLDCELKVVTRHDRQKKILESWNIETVQSQDIDPKSMHIVVDCSGSSSGFELANRVVRPGGTIVLKSTFQENITLNIAPTVVNEITIMGSRCGPFPLALKMLSEGSINTAAMIDGEYPLNEGLYAFDHAAQPGIFKILLRPTG